MHKTAHEMQPDAATRAASGSNPPSDQQKSQAENIRLAAKLRERRMRWEWNRKLGVVSIALLVLVAIGSFISYRYHSRTAAETFRLRAEEAFAEGDFEAQIKWLGRYSLLKPNDIESLVSLGVAADEAADLAEPANRFSAVSNARKQLSASIARLSNLDAQQGTIDDLRERLIERLMQLGGNWYAESERQVLLLEAEPEDPRVSKWLAISLIGQVRANVYQERKPIAPFATSGAPSVDPWVRLSRQPVGEVLAVAVDRNPKDLDLIASYLLAFANRPELFDQSEASVEEHQQRVDTLVSQLLLREDSRSRLVLYSFALAQDRAEQAKEIILEAAPLAAKRLASAGVPTGESPTEEKGVDDRLSEFQWDYQLLARAASTVSQDDFQQAEKWYDLLLSKTSDSLSMELLDSVYLSAGQLHALNDDAERAIEIWKSGLEKFNPNSLDLRGSIAMVKAQTQSPEAEEAVEQYSEAVELADRRLSSDTERDLAVRAQFGRRIDTAKWRLQVARGFLAANKGQAAKAIKNFRDALSNTADVSTDNRRVAALQLAQLTAQRGEWDRAAEAYDEAVENAPDDPVVRMRAAEAWTRAGNRLRAIEHWRVLGTSGALPIQIASAEALFQYQLRLLPRQRDFGSVHAALKRIEPALERADVQGDVKLAKALQEAKSRYEILKASLPPAGVQVEQHLSSEQFGESLSEIASRFEKTAHIQVFAAKRLAEIGHLEKASKAVSNLQSLVGEDATAVAIVKAEIDSESGDAIAAHQRLIDQAKRDADRSRELLRLAANYALNERDHELAYQTLASIAPSQQTAMDWFDLARMARFLPNQSKVLKGSETPLTAKGLAARWKAKLQEVEGGTNSYLTFLEVTDLIDQLQADQNEIARSDPRLLKAHRLVRSILSQRPRWGEAISLRGSLLAIEQRHEQAVTELRRGVAAGDQRLQTQLLLFEQLLALGRDEEAEEQLQVLSFVSDTAFDPYSVNRIALARRQKDPTRALEIARQGVEVRPEDYLAHLVLGRTAIALSASESVDKTGYLTEAGQAIDRAHELAGDGNFNVYLARLTLVLSQPNNVEKLQSLAEQIRSSELDEYSKATLISRVLMALGKYDDAEEMLLHADKLKPSAQTQIALASLYRKTNDAEGELKALRTAQQRNPQNAKLRAKLAQTLAVRAGEDIDWDKIATLLDDENVATTNNRLLYAMLLAAHGDSQQQQESASLLRDFIADGNARSDEAKRILINVLRKQYEESDLPSDNPLAQRWTSEIRSLSASLAGQAKPETDDLYRYADFLLSLQDDSELPTVKRLLEQLQRRNGGAMAALDIGIRYAQRTGGEQTAPVLVEEWVGQRLATDANNDKDVIALAGVSLIRNGFVDEGLNYFAKSYQQDPQQLAAYIMMLGRAKRFDEAIRVSEKHYREHQTAESAILLVESLMNQDRPPSSAQDNLIQQALHEFGTNPQLLDGVATLRMLHAQYELAISIFEQVRKLDPFRIRTLNNLALALSQVSGRAAEGIEPIEQAIKLAGEDPELLDTRGSVLLSAGRPEEAVATFKKAVRQSDDPRFRFHLVLALQAAGRNLEAERHLKQTDLQAIDPADLIPAEREILKQFKTSKT